MNALDISATAFSVIIAMVSAIVAWLASRKLKRRLDAEHVLVAKVHNMYVKRSALDELRAMCIYIEKEDETPDVLLNAYESVMREALTELDKENARLIETVLNQPSSAGRQAFLRKLIRETAVAQ